MKKVAVIGLGRFGFNLVKALAQKKDIEIMAIDVKESIVNEAKDFATQPIVMDATIKDNLMTIGIADFDYAIVSPGPSLEPSILIVHILREIGVGHIIAKALSEDHEKILQLVGATEIIFPERDEAQKLAQKINAPNLIDFFPLQSGFVVQEIAAPDMFVGKTLIEIDLRKKYRLTVLAIKSIIPDVSTVNPSGDVLIKESDILIVFGENPDIERLHRNTAI
jgi:trk system potassium uptake protein